MNDDFEAQQETLIKEAEEAKKHAAELQSQQVEL
jgi:hypothetical protein